MIRPKKIHTRNLITKENSCGSKIPHPPPITFLMVRPYKTFTTLSMHVLLIDSFLAPRDNFFPREPLDQLEISALPSWNDFRGPSVRALPHPSRVSPPRACSLFRPLLPSACYAMVLSNFNITFRQVSLNNWLQTRFLYTGRLPVAHALKGFFLSV